MRATDRIGTNMPTLGVEVDFGPRGVRAVYFRLTDKKVTRTIEADEPDVFIDLDSRNKIVGIELINPAVVKLAKVFRNISKRFESELLKNLRETRIRELQKMVTV